MKHLWVVESSGGRKWSPSGWAYVARSFFTKRAADRSAKKLLDESPGLKWRVRKYVRDGEA